MGRILGWKNPLRKVVPRGEFLVQNVDLWVGKDSGKDLGDSGMEKSITESGPRR